TWGVLSRAGGYGGGAGGPPARGPPPRDRFLDAGFPPYRSDIDHAPRELADRAATYSDGPLAALKQIYDPAGIIAPGRFLVAGR
ncbi:hypothetical protein, partial [Nocardia wallacei]|uniref:hypothetical protein n=1 Tax=Nocardia wallacei TaxID=480035 RepID=UPI0024563708